MPECKMGFLAVVCLITIFLVACDYALENETKKATATGTDLGVTREYSLDDFHRVPIPEEYARLINPIVADEASLARGKDAFILYCAVCHGETGLGDGLAAENLFPPVPAIAETQRTLRDDYLYFRIRDGGVIEPYNSAMPTWEDILDERTIWDLINYVRSLDSESITGNSQEQ